MTNRPMRNEGESYEQYCFRLSAYIEALETELFWYRNMEENIRDLHLTTGYLVDYYNRHRQEMREARERQYEGNT